MGSCSRGLLSVALVVGAAHAGPGVPRPSVTLSPTEIRLAGKPGEPLQAGVQIVNSATCGVGLTQQRTSAPGITVTCDSSLGGRQLGACTIIATSAEEGRIVDGLILEARIAEDCKAEPLAHIAQRRTSELDPLEKQLWDHTRGGPLQSDFDRALAQFDAEHANDLDPSDKLRKAAADEKAMIAQAYAEAKRSLADLITRQRMKLELALRDRTSLEAFDAAVQKLRDTAQRDIDDIAVDRDDRCAEPNRIEARRRALLREMREGSFHSECSKTESEIRRDTGERLDVHLARAGGYMRPATDEEIEAKDLAIDQQVEAARRVCKNYRDKHAQSVKDWSERVKRKLADREKVVAAREATIERARKDLEQLEANARKSDDSQRARIAAVDKRLEAELKAAAQRKDGKRAEVQRQRKKMIDDFEAARRAHVDKQRELTDRVQKLRAELGMLETQIKNAQHEAVVLKVRIDATFAR